MSSQFAMENMESDELLSWILLNQDLSDFDMNFAPSSADVEAYASSLFNESHVNNLDTYHLNNNINSGLNSNMHNFTNDTNGNFTNSSFNTTSHNQFELHKSNSMDSQSVSSKKKSKRESPNSFKKEPGLGKKRPRGEEDIESRVNELRAENADLQAHLLNVTQRTTEVQKQRTEMEKRMHAKLQEIGEKDDSDQSELAKLVKEYTDIYADYGKCRQREVAFHVNQLEKLIVPTLTTKMCLWALQQDRGFFQRSKSPMYDMLSKELEITAEQSEKIQERREKIKLLLNQLNESLSLLGAFKTSIERKHTSYDNVCGRVQAAATPKQVVQFQLWITKNAQWLSSYIPDFTRSVHHTPNVEFIPSAASNSNPLGASSSSSSSSSSTNNGGSGINHQNGGSSGANPQQQQSNYTAQQGQYPQQTQQHSNSWLQGSGSCSNANGSGSSSNSSSSRGDYGSSVFDYPTGGL